MSLFNRSREAIAAPRLDYRTLVAVLGAGRAAADPAPAPCALEARMRELPALSRLVTVLLGREGWRQAARALGGRFAERQPL